MRCCFGAKVLQVASGQAVGESWKISLADRSAGHEHQAAGNRIQRRAEVHYTYISRDNTYIYVYILYNNTIL